MDIKVVAKVDHASNLLGRIVKKGEEVEIPEEELKANESLYAPAEGEKKKSGPASKEELKAIVLEKKLAKPEEIANLSYDQLKDLVAQAKD